MQGCAGVFPALVVVYISNVANIPFDMTMYIMSVIVIAIGSVGIAGVPGTATMAASVFPLVVQALVRTSHPSAQFLLSIH